MSEPWLDDRWLSLTWDLIVNVDQLAAVALADTGVDLFMTGSLRGTPIRVAQERQAKMVWQEFSQRDPVETRWVLLGHRLAINLRHLAAVERRGGDVILHLGSLAAAHDDRFCLKSGPETDASFGQFSQGGRKQILAL